VIFLKPHRAHLIQATRNEVLLVKSATDFNSALLNLVHKRLLDAIPDYCFELK
jgi:hypothetical protein